MTLFFQIVLNGLVNAAVYAVLAIGFGLVRRSLLVFHVAYGGLFVLCAYLFYVLTVQAGLPPTAAAIVTTACAGAIGWFTEILLYRPFYERRASPGVVLIASLGVFVILQNAIAMAFGDEPRTIPRAAVSQRVLGDVVLTNLQVLQLAVGCALVGLMLVLTTKLRIFKAIWAMGDQPELIPVLGLPIYRLRGMTMALSTAFASVAACLITLDVGIAPSAGMSYLLIAAVAVLVGGIGSFWGWVLGATLVALLESLVVWQFSARWLDLIVFALLIAVLLTRPAGLGAYRRRAEER